MVNNPVYLSGVKQWQPFSPFAQADPYMLFHREHTPAWCCSVDVDGREIRRIGNEYRTVAYIERECCQERIKHPLAYLTSFMDNSDMRLKLDSLARDARILGIPAYLVCHSADVTQFVVIRLPWDKQTFRNWSAAQYTRFLVDLGKVQKAA